MAETPILPTTTVKVNIIQSVAILIDGNNIERSLHSMTNDENCMINFDHMIPKLLRGRGLSRLIYFREGKQISSKLADRLLDHYMGSVVPCHKSADIPLSICATQIARKVDTIIILSGDSDYVELVRHLKGEGVRIEIAAVKATTAQILIDESDHFMEITEEDSFSLTPKRSGNKRSSSKSNTQRINSSRSATNSSASSRSTSNKSSSNKNKNSKNTDAKDSENTVSKSSKSNKAGTPKRSSKKKSTETNKPEADTSIKKITAKSKSRSKSTNKSKSRTAKKATKSRKKPVKAEEPLDDFSY